MGTFIVASAAHIAGFTPTILHLVLGGVLAFLPDFDLIVPILRKRYENIPKHHTTLMHRPIVLLPLASTAAFFIGGPFWALVAFICITWHYVHDTKGFGGGGLQWFWPYSKKEWSLSGPERPAKQIPFRVWLRDNWMHPSELSVREVAIGSLALSVACAQWGFLAMCAAFFFSWMGVLGIWTSSRKLRPRTRHSKE